MIDLERMLGGLERVQRTSDGWLALCPCHDDRKPSLHVSVSGSGKVLVHCFAGCSQERLLSHFRGGDVLEHGLPETIDRANGAHGHPTRSLPPISALRIENWHRDLTGDQRRYLRINRSISDAVINRYLVGYHRGRFTVPIADINGRFQDVRLWLPPEQRKPTDAKILHFERGRGGARLFPIDQLQKDRLLLVEGELDALAAISVGLASVTVTCGAGNWPEEFSTDFAMKEVIVFGDNDQPGREGAMMRARSLCRAGAKVKVVSWPSGRAEGWDVTDELLRL